MTRQAMPAPQVALIGLFVTALITAQLTASKVLGFELPFAIPVAGETLALPGAALAYALTFFASDVYAELYGRNAAQILVNVAFGLNFVMLLLVWSTIAAPAAGNSPVAPETFATVLGSSTNIVIASLAAYLVSQNWDVLVFHALRERTDGAHLWLRNIASTGTSQLLDTVIFVGLGFYLVPRFLGTGDPAPLAVVASLLVGQYLLKLLIAVLDTPFVYLVVGALRRREQGSSAASTAD
ncbi:integral membrane protein [Halodesulfurarchaeum formicicum]|uniref:Probable queuosine precursor transporter n=1 Tax=Halodesulfurarchaeum formicicum TaxID=1873524 RepID=A0A1D8S728_9EURY|nr:queuosine precursor transporter [Halodesulfurarchaeum formicicum]AOW81149.1 integral membrane protein [Halodesulfurarchaeum formicicum]APE96492.1 integral membrane protein [Halodesulfurarchaeum formicicum]